MPKPDCTRRAASSWLIQMDALFFAVGPGRYHGRTRLPRSALVWDHAILDGPPLFWIRGWKQPMVPVRAGLPPQLLPPEPTRVWSVGSVLTRQFMYTSFPLSSKFLQPLSRHRTGGPSFCTCPASLRQGNKHSQEFLLLSARAGVRLSRITQRQVAKSYNRERF